MLFFRCLKSRFSLFINNVITKEIFQKELRVKRVPDLYRSHTRRDQLLLQLVTHDPRDLHTAHLLW